MIQIFKWHPMGMKLIEYNKIEPAEETIFDIASPMVALSDYDAVKSEIEAMKIVAPIADKLGVTIQELVQLLKILNEK